MFRRSMLRRYEQMAPHSAEQIHSLANEVAETNLRLPLLIPCLLFLSITACMPEHCSMRRLVVPID